LQALTCMQGCRAASARRQEQKCARPDTALPLRNANSHADRHCHACPSAPAMQHSGGADLTAAVHR
jgi:hypothetical protein